MRILMVCGSRELIQVDQIPECLEHHLRGYSPEELSVITGGAQGADETALTFLQQRGYNVVVVLPDYKRRGRGAPLWRNVCMVRVADEVVAFWDGKSTGTQHAIESATRRKKPLTIWTPDASGLLACRGVA